MMWLGSQKQQRFDESDLDSFSSGEEIPVWVRGEQRWVSGITEETTCMDVIQVLLKDEEVRGRHGNLPEQYHITERWRGVEQPLDSSAPILDIWNAWGTAQTEVKISLRRIKNDRPPSSRRTRCKSDSSIWSDRSAWRTIHPKRLQMLQNEVEPSSTEELLKLVLAQGEVIRRQLKKLRIGQISRHNEHQIGYLEDKTHRARVRKHGSNYLLETYLKGLSEAVEPEIDPVGLDKNSDSGVITEGDSEQSNNTNNKQEASFERFSPASDELQKDIKDDDSISSLSETTLLEQLELFEKISRLNKQLLKEEENLLKLSEHIKKHEKDKESTEKSKSDADEVSQRLTKLRATMAKSACEMQHNEVVLEETMEMLENRRIFLENLHRDLVNEDKEYEMLQAMLYSAQHNRTNYNNNSNVYHTKELLDTLV